MEQYDKTIDGYNLINTYIPTPTDNESGPQTGERSLLALWIYLICISCCVIIAAIRYKKKWKRFRIFNKN